MSAVLTGIVKYSRVMEGTYKSGKREGQTWEFLSLEVVDVMMRDPIDEGHDDIILRSRLVFRKRAPHNVPGGTTERTHRREPRQQEGVVASRTPSSHRPQLGIRQRFVLGGRA